MQTEASFFRAGLLGALDMLWVLQVTSRGKQALVFVKLALWMEGEKAGRSTKVKIQRM